MVWIWCLCCEKFRCDFVARTFAFFALVGTELHRVLCSGPNAPQPLRNAEEHEFRIQWYGSGAFVAKNSNATSLHELLH